MYGQTKMKLIKYIEQHYNGNKTAFAVTNNTTKQAIYAMIKKDTYYVYDGMLVIKRYDLK